jgi:hypothetical protein
MNLRSMWCAASLALAGFIASCQPAAPTAEQEQTSNGKSRTSKATTQIIADDPDKACVACACLWQNDRDDSAESKEKCEELLNPAKGSPCTQGASFGVKTKVTTPRPGVDPGMAKASEYLKNAQCEDKRMFYAGHSWYNEPGANGTPALCSSIRDQIKTLIDQNAGKCSASLNLVSYGCGGAADPTTTWQQLQLIWAELERNKASFCSCGLGMITINITLAQYYQHWVPGGMKPETHTLTMWCNDQTTPGYGYSGPTYGACSDLKEVKCSEQSMVKCADGNGKNLYAKCCPRSMPGSVPPVGFYYSTVTSPFAACPGDVSQAPNSCELMTGTTCSKYEVAPLPCNSTKSGRDRLFCACDGDKGCTWQPSQTVGGQCSNNADCLSGICATSTATEPPSCRPPAGSCVEQKKQCSKTSDCCSGACLNGFCNAAHSPLLPRPGKPIPMIPPTACQIGPVNPETGTSDPCPAGYGCAPTDRAGWAYSCRPIITCPGNGTANPSGTPCCVAYGYVLKQEQMCCGGLFASPAGFAPEDNTMKCMP